MADGKLEKIADDQYRLSGDVDFYNASSLATAGSFPVGSQIKIDLGGMEKTDSGALALLVNWHRQALRQNSSIEYSNTPARLLSLTHLYDLDSVLRIS